MRQFAKLVRPLLRAMLAVALVLCCGTPSIRAAESPAAEHSAAVESSSGAEGAAVGDAAGGHAAAEGAHPDYNSPPLIPEIPLLVFSLVLFTVFLLVMRPAVWMPLMNSLNSREQRVEKAEAGAKAALVEAERLAAQAEKRMAEVHQQVAGLLATARQEAEARKAAIISQAEAQADRIKSAAIDAIRQARDEALRELDDRVEGQAVSAFNHVTGRQ